MTDLQKNDITEPSNLPPLPEQSEQAETTEGKKKTSRKLILLLTSILFMAIGAIFLANSFIDGLLSESDQKVVFDNTKAVKPLEVAKGIPLVPPVPGVAKTTEGVKESNPQKIEPHNLLEQIPKKVPTESKAFHDGLVVPGNSYPPDSIDLEALLDRVKNMELKVLELEVNNELMQNSFKSVNEALDETKQAQNVLDHKVKNTSDKVQRMAKLLHKKKISQNLSHKIKSTTPPMPLSFALWNDRENAFINWPKGKLKMISEGEIISHWKVMDINLNNKSVTYRNTVTGQKTLLKQNQG